MCHEFSKYYRIRTAHLADLEDLHATVDQEEVYHDSAYAEDGGCEALSARFRVRACEAPVKLCGVEALFCRDSRVGEDSDEPYRKLFRHLLTSSKPVSFTGSLAK